MGLGIPAPVTILTLQSRSKIPILPWQQLQSLSGLGEGSLTFPSTTQFKCSLGLCTMSCSKAESPFRSLLVAAHWSLSILEQALQLPLPDMHELSFPSPPLSVWDPCFWISVHTPRGRELWSPNPWALLQSTGFRGNSPFPWLPLLSCSRMFLQCS